MGIFWILTGTPLTAGQATVKHGVSDSLEETTRDEAMEQALWELVNQLRANPARFYHQVIEPYLHTETAIHFSSHTVHSLRKEMLQSPPLPTLQSEERLRQTALLLAKDLVAHQQGRLSHTMSNGTSFAQRFRAAGMGCGAENLYTGLHRTAEQVLADWLIDEGVPGYGHRHNLLNPQYRSTGIVVLRNRKGQIWVVQDFGCMP